MSSLTKLSNAQRKELLVRGRPLRIALPAPDAEDYDPRAFALRALPEIEPGWTVRAEERTLPVDPRVRSAGVSQWLGTPLAEQDCATRWHVLVVCVVVELQAVASPRQPPGLVQWPGGDVADRLGSAS